MSGYITKWNGNAERTQVRCNDRYGFNLYDCTDRIPFDKLESFLVENLK